jgi:hypothetical protein
MSIASRTPCPAPQSQPSPELHRAARQRPSRLALGLTLLVGSLIAACGGGGGTPGAGVGGSEVATSESQLVGIGTVTGFGSVIIDGVKYDDSLASVNLLSDDSSRRDVSLDAIRLGMRVEMSADGQGRLRGLGISPELKGPISSVNVSTKTFTLLGQTVRVITEGANMTVFEGISGMSALEDKMVVEVHGTRNAVDQIVATRIERKSQDDAASLRLTGLISGLDTTARRFSIGSLAVDYAAIAPSSILPSASALANGKRVTVFSGISVASGVLTAQGVSVRGMPSGSPNDRVRLSGLSSPPDTVTRTFLLNGVRVSYASEIFKDGSVADLGSTRLVRVRGTLASDGTVSATEIKFVTKHYSNDDDPTIEAEVSGVITEFVSRSSFKVRGVPIDASATTITFESGTEANLADGVLVKIEGTPSAGGLLPTKIRFATTKDSRTRWLAGALSDRSLLAGVLSFRLMGLDVRLADNATIKQFNGSTASVSDLVNGQVVRLNGAVLSDVFIAREVVLMPDNSGQLPREIEGVASEVNVSDSGVGNLKIGNVTVTTSVATVFEGALANLKNGVRVEAYGPLVGTAPALTLAATKVELKLPESGSRVRVSGMVSDFKSISEPFRIGTQRVNVVDASKVSGQLANGRFAKAKGAMKDGVLNVNNASEHELEVK